MSLISRPLIRAVKPLEAIGQLGGHLKRGVPHPVGARTGNPMALISALPLDETNEFTVLTFLDRSDPVETYDMKPGSGDNAVIIAPTNEIHVSFVKGVCLGDWRGQKVQFGPEIEEPVDLDVDPTGLNLAASDAWVDMVDELGCDCSKWGGYPLWASTPVDVEAITGRSLRFHHRLTSDLVDFESDLGEGAVIYVFVDADGGQGGAVLWQRSGGGRETKYHNVTGRRM